jgi:hypothetical protein
MKTKNIKLENITIKKCLILSKKGMKIICNDGKASKIIKEN